MPFIAVLYLREPRTTHRLVARALFVSFVADAASLGLIDWRVGTYVYPVVQISVIAWAVIGRDALRILFVCALWLAAALSALMWSGGTVEIVVTVGGAVAVVALIWTEARLGRLRDVLIVYFGMGAPFWAMFNVLENEAFVAVWIGYQVCRIYGTGMMVESMWKERKLKIA